MIADLRWRRIPNLLTLPAILLAIAGRVVFQGWPGLGLAVAGALLAPTLLLLTRGGKGLGMGDLKLAAAIGAIVGPILAVAAMLLTTVMGGVLAIVCLLRPGGLYRQFIGTLFIGFPFRNKKSTTENPPVENESTVDATMPYGIAIGMGSILTLAVCWWTGNENWFLSFVGIGANL
jgi:prepilin peptidase CpaA